LDDVKRLAVAVFIFIAAVALFAICLIFTTASIVRPRLAARNTPPAVEAGSPSPTATIETSSTPFLDLTTTPVLTVTFQTSATPAIAPTAPEPSKAPTITPSPTFAALAMDAWCIPWNAPSVSAQVVKVIDGVTIEVRLDGKTVPVRYIGVNLLEFGDDAALWQRMTDQNQQLVGGQTVLLIQDRTAEDGNGQLPRYVISGGRFVNHDLVASGYAVAASAPPDQSCDAYFLEAQQQATQARVGLWAPEATPTRILLPSPTPTPLVTGPMVIGLIDYKGTPWEEPDEFVEVLNDGTEPIQLKGWTLSDEDQHVFTFPNFVLGPGQHCRVYTNQYSPTTCGFSFFNPYPIWENDADCAYLKDPLGDEISVYCYY
jgi:micrococcal nuclease